MKVTIAEPAQIQLRNTSEDNRRKVMAWIDILGRWETDPYVRQHSKKLPESNNDYILITSTDIRIFFELEEDTITVLDVTKQSTIERSGKISEDRSR